ncbi:MAG: hypothetical protein KME29_05030 [Calothrix sp. FI2-JRJ7]|jgi:hypothetical protein|nr:hypothetical protein [Calothrix sp. FI2-JRJ7]
MDNFNISELCARYGLNSRQTIYDRLKDLRIRQTERGKISFADLALMDQLDKHIKGGGTIDNFVHGPQVVQPDKITLSSSVIDRQEAPPFEALLGLLERLFMAQQQAPSIIQKYEQLEEIAAKSWIITTSEIEVLIGFKPRLLGCRYGSFRIERCGKVGRQVGWVVKKVAPL